MVYTCVDISLYGVVSMGWHIERALAAAARSVNPLTWRRVWKKLEGKRASELVDDVAREVNAQFAQIGRVSQYRYWWWANPLGSGLIIYGIYKVWYLSYMAEKQKKGKF